MVDNAINTANTDNVSDDLKGRFLTFYIEDVFYGIELLNVIEIISVQPITIVPNLPDYVKGITNLRGKVVPIIDVRLKFGAPEREYDDKTCIIVVNIEDMQVGLIVDSVAEVLSVGADKRAAPPEISNMVSNRYLSSISKVDDKVVLHINLDAFFEQDLIKQI